MKKIDWSAIRNERRFLGFRMGMTGVAVGAIAFVIALCGFMWLGVSVFAVGFSIALTGFVAHMSYVGRR
ncbi:hypothetical protein [Luteibacter yeojuensis]